MCLRSLAAFLGSMVREERNPQFWRAVASHPDVEPHVLFGVPAHVLDDLISDPEVWPLAAEHGGFLLLPKGDGVLELHTMFTPEGWGREVAAAFKSTLGLIFPATQELRTQEVEGWWRSAPPRSYGWKPTGDFAPSALNVRLRPWVLTPEAWASSPVFRRHSCQ